MQRTLKVGTQSIGLIGLDIALNRINNNPGIDLEAATDHVYAEVAAKNYIPAPAADAYRKAIAEQIRRMRAGEGEQTGELVIRILGPGCVSCNNLEKMVFEVMAELKIAADILQIHDPDEIGRFGLIPTPALVINGEVKSTGRLPTRARIEEWLRERTEER